MARNDSPVSHRASSGDVMAGLTHAGSSPGWRETPLGRRGQSNKIYGHDSRPTFGSNLRVPITRRYRGAGSPAHGSLQCRFSQWKGAVCCKERRRECGGARGEHPAGGADWWWRGCGVLLEESELCVVCRAINGCVAGVPSLPLFGLTLSSLLSFLCSVPATLPSALPSSPSSPAHYRLPPRITVPGTVFELLTVSLYPPSTHAPSPSTPAQCMASGST